MHFELGYIFFYCAIVFITGLLFLILIGRTVFSKHNLFINIALSWALGNSVFAAILHVLAFLNKLDAVTSSSFSIFSAFVLVGLFIVILINKKKLYARISFINIAALVAILIFSYPLLRDALYSYLIDWDAVAIWFLKAKSFFFATGVAGNEFFDNKIFYQYAHKAYPIGFPLLIAAFYRIIGSVNDQIVQLYIVSYYISFVCLFYGAVKKFFKSISTVIGIIISLGFMIFPLIVIYSHNGYADVPLSFVFALCTTMFIFLIGEKEMQNKIQYVKLILIVSGLGAMLKNEGLPFMVIVVFASLMVLLSELKKQKEVKLFIISELPRLAALSMIVIIPVAWWYIFKSANAVDNTSYLYKLSLGNISLSRLKIVFNYSFVEVSNLSKYGVLLVPSLMLLVIEYTFILTRRMFRIILPTAILIAQLFVYVAIYMTTSVPLIWQVESSLDRLLLHILPALYIVMLYSLRPAYKIARELL